MKITKIVVSKGTSVNKATGETWTKTNYEITAEDEFKNEAALNKAKGILTKHIDRWLLGKPKSTPPSTQTKQKKKTLGTPSQQGKNVPPINPWTNYNKQPSKPGQEGWAFAKFLPEELIVKLDLRYQKIGNMEYRLSGRNNTLVNRRPIQHKQDRDY